ncbi:MAG: polyprenyl synthetase family protein [Candidatus Sericytochromatia bacterium]|nr:polyprenyl synthetase family protein [Candidatus Tanganyikabacteria bacterium]
MDLARWLGNPSPPLARILDRRLALFRDAYESLGNWPVVALPRGIAEIYALPAARGNPLAEGCVLFFLAADVIDDAQDGDLPPDIGWPEAVNAGQALLFGALDALSEAAPGAAVAREVADAGRALASGQAIDLTLTWDSAPGEDTVMKAVQGKAGASLKLFARMGALAADRPEAEVATWGEIGEALGTAVQLRSDVRDLQGADSRDFQQSKATLPVAYAIGRSGGAFQAAAAKGDRAAVCEAIRACGGFTFVEFKIDGLALDVADAIERLGLPADAGERLKALAGAATRGAVVPI